MVRKKTIISFMLILSLLVFTGQSALATIQSITRVSTDSSGNQASGGIYPSTSGDGRYVVFASSANNLVSGDTNAASDIFLKDTQTGETTRVSTSATGGQANSNSINPKISADGRYVIFESSASNLVSFDMNFASDIFKKDTQTGAITRISTSSTGSQANSDSTYASVSADGRYVSFMAGATNLVSGDTNGFFDIFVKDTQTGTTTRVSTSSTGAQVNGDSFSTSISADGRYVVFKSDADNLVANDTNNYGDVFVKDTQTQVVTMASTNSAGNQANSVSYNPVISGNGRYVAFESWSSDLVSDDTNNYGDIFVKDLETGTTIRVSTSATGTQADYYSQNASISDDGRYVAFSSAAHSLVLPDTYNSFDIFVKDTQTGEIEKVSTDINGNQANNGCYYPSISADARFVAFHSSASNLVANDTNNTTDIFLVGTNVEPTPPPAPDPNVVMNPSFETDVDSDGFPDYWTINYLQADDGRSADYAKEGTYSLKINGDTTKQKSAKQSVSISGSAGTELIFGGYNKTVNSTGTGSIAAMVYLKNNGVTQEIHTLQFAFADHDWQQLAKTIIPKKDFDSAEVSLIFNNRTGATYFDNVKLSKTDSFTALDLQNSSFEIDDDLSGYPDNWLANILQAGDGRSADYAKEGTYSLKIIGDTSKVKNAKQVINFSGSAGTELIIGGYSKTVDTTSTIGNIMVVAALKNTDGTQNTYSLFFGREPHDWQYLSAAIVAPKDFSSVEVYVYNWAQTGFVYFDGLKLIKP